MGPRRGDSALERQLMFKTKDNSLRKASSKMLVTPVTDLQPNHEKSSETTVSQLTRGRTGSIHEMKQINIPEDRVKTAIISTSKHLMSMEAKDKPSPDLSFRETTLLKAPSMRIESDFSILKKSSKLGKRVRILKKGGVYISTSAGPIQVGCPPETIKDCMVNGLEFPQVFIVPPTMFSAQKKFNMFEFEFPCYFNTFIKKRKTVLVTLPLMVQRLKNILQESLLGPEKQDLENLEGEFAPNRLEYMPNLYEECKSIRDDGLTVDTLVDFLCFHQKIEVNTRSDDLTGKSTLSCRIDDVEIVVYESDVGNEDLMLKLYDNDVCIYDNPLYQGINDEGNRESTMDNHDHWSIEKYGVYEFHPPLLGVTMVGSSHGFDPNGLTCGFLLWFNRVALIIDPPVNFDIHLKKMGIPPRLVRGILLTHCHADHDSGTFQKILQENRTVVYTTSTIMHSFLRKYSNVCGYNPAFLQSLFRFHELLPHEPIKVMGGAITCHYACHTIPCIGFEASYGGKSVYYSGDHAYSRNYFDEAKGKGIMNETRYNFHANKDFSSFDVVLHECGIPPIHTPASELEKLPAACKKKMYVVHCADNKVPEGFRAPPKGIKGTLRVEGVVPPPSADMNRMLMFLGSVVALQSLTLDDFAGVIDLISKVNYKKGDVICKQGQLSDRFWVIMEGAVGVRSTLSKKALALMTDSSLMDRFGDEDHDIAALGAGDFFGESALWCDTNVKRNATCVARTDASCMTISGLAWLNYLGHFRGSRMMNMIDQMREASKYNIVDTVRANNNSLGGLLSLSQIHYIGSVSEMLVVGEGEELQRSGKDAQGMFLIHSGKLRVSLKENKEKRFTVMNSSGGTCNALSHENFGTKHRDRERLRQGETFGSGIFIGDFTALMRNGKGKLHIVCEESGWVFFLPRTEFKRLMHRFPGLLLMFYDTFFAE